MLSEIIKTCSHKISPFARNSLDIFHLTLDRQRTFCGRDCSEWLRMGEVEDHEIDSAYLCTRCHKKAVK